MRPALLLLLACLASASAQQSGSSAGAASGAALWPQPAVVELRAGLRAPPTLPCRVQPAARAGHQGRGAPSVFNHLHMRALQHPGEEGRGGRPSGRQRPRATRASEPPGPQLHPPASSSSWPGRAGGQAACCCASSALRRAGLPAAAAPALPFCPGPWRSPAPLMLHGRPPRPP